MSTIEVPADIMRKVAAAIVGKNINVFYTNAKKPPNTRIVAGRKEICIPFTADEIRKWGAFFHELQHVRHTPKMLFDHMGKAASPVEKNFLNVAEDVRIESIAPLNVSALLQYNNMEIIENSLSKLSAQGAEFLITILVNTHGYLNLDLENLFLPPEIAEKVRKMYPVIDSVRGSTNPDDAIKVAEQLVSMMRNIIKEAKQNGEQDSKQKQGSNNASKQQGQGKGTGQAQDEEQGEQQDTDTEQETNGDSRDEGKQEQKRQDTEQQKPAQQRGNNNAGQEQQNADAGQSTQQQNFDINNIDTKKLARQVRRIIRKRKREIASSSQMKTEIDEMQSFTQQNETSPTIIRSYINNDLNEEYKNEIRLSNRLAEETLRLIHDLSSIREETSYAGKFSTRLYINHQHENPYWFLRRGQSRELNLKNRIALLVDVSGSMCEYKKDVYAFISSRVFWIVMTKLRIPFTFYYFDHRAYPVADIKYLTPLSMGNTRPRVAVEKVPQEDKIIVLTDGIFCNDDLYCGSATGRRQFSARLWGITVGEDSLALPSLFWKNRRYSVMKPRKLPQVVSQVLMNILLR